MALGLLSACGNNQPPAPAQAAGQGGGPPPPLVTLQQVAASEVHDSTQALGTVKARESITVSAKVSETVQQVHFESGDTVARGAPLVTLSGQQQQAALAAANATAVEAERLYKRLSDLGAQQLIARAQLDAQRATRDAALAQVRQIQANLADRVIRAPFTGVLGIRQVSPGALVTPGTAIATLDAIDRVYVDFPLPEAQLSRLGDGERLRGTVAAWPEAEFDGTVSSVDARLDPQTRALTVRGEFANPERKLRPGMLMTVRLFGGRRQALMVPEIAVTQVGGDSFVYTVDAANTAKQQPVQTGIRQDGKVEIVTGLAGGERIVVDGTGKVRDGQKVQAAPAGAAVAGNTAAADPATAATRN